MIELTLPAQFVLDYGAGYPLTYLFDVPDVPGLVGQWSSDGTSWTNITAAPAGRFDGIEAARFTSSRAYLSVAFPANTNRMWLRVWDGTAEAGTYRGVAHYYDDRDAPVIFTYDDWRGQAESLDGMALHRAVGLWASGGINSGRVSSWPNIEADTIAGWFEPINHGRNHMRPAQGDYDPDPEGIAYDEVFVGGQEIIDALTLPPQSRERLYGWIRPGGDPSAAQRAALAAAKYLIDRDEASTAYTGYPQWSPAEGMFDLWGPTRRTIYFALQTDHAAQADAMIADTVTAIANRHAAHFYSYMHYWPAAPGSDLERALETIGAHDNIWSVGWGHFALYRRTAEVVRASLLPYAVGVARKRASNTTLTVDIPAGEVGDLLIAIRVDTTAASPQTASPGWTLLGTESAELAVWWKIAAADDMTVSLTGAQMNRFADAVVLRYSNVDQANPILGFARSANASASAATAPAATADEGLALHIYKATATRIQPPLGGMTRIMREPTATGSACSLVSERATLGDPDALTAPLSSPAASVGVTLVINGGTGPAYEPITTIDRRRGAIAAL